MDGPVEQPSHTHDQTLTELEALRSFLIARITETFRHNLCSSVVELMGILHPVRRNLIKGLLSMIEDSSHISWKNVIYFIYIQRGYKNIFEKKRESVPWHLIGFLGYLLNVPFLTSPQKLN